MEHHFNSRFSSQGSEREGDGGSISPPRFTSSDQSGGNKHHEQMEERNQHHVETYMPQDHQSMLEQSNSDERDMPTEKMSKRRRRVNRWSRLATDWWIWELCAMLTSLLSLVAIVLILRIHEGRPLPDWPFSITINSLVSIFATILSATMLVPIAAGIGQAKWHWFQQYHALSDMDVYDQASRGPWGALMMLWDIRWRHVSSLGALIAVLALAIDPFVQQVASYPSERVASPLNSTLPVRLAVQNSQNSAASFKGPVYSGLFGFGSSTVTPDCPSGNCTWIPYQTLAACSQCVDITDLVKFSESNKQVPSCDLGNIKTPCLWTLPNSLSLGYAGDDADFKAHDTSVLNTSGTLPPITLDRVGSAIVNFSLLAINSKNGGGQPLATECSLYWCINTYNATVNNTVFNETFRSSWYNATSALPLADLAGKTYSISNGTSFYNITPPTGAAKSQANINLTNLEMESQSYSNDVFDEEDYLVDTSVSTTIGSWLGPLLSGNATPDIVPESSSDVIELFIGNLTQVPAIFDRLAQYLTIAFRAGDEDPVQNPGMAQALGVTWQSETIVRVRWAWLSLPAALLAASLVFLGATVLGTTRGRVGIWKSSTLALLFHGLGERGEEGVGGVEHVVGMEERARRMWVRLDEGEGDGGRLVEKHGLPNEYD